MSTTLLSDIIVVIYWYMTSNYFWASLMLLSILYIYYQVGTTDYEVLLTFVFSTTEQKFL